MNAKKIRESLEEREANKQNEVVKAVIKFED